mgnify:CR=1 FL=1
MEETLERSALLEERQKTHGSFVNNAQVSQFFKRYIRKSQTGYADGGFSDVHQEALDMICLKLSRILSGQANFKDHWDDIAGYAQLAAEACNAQKRDA